MNKVTRALLVLILTDATRAWLRANDPKALEQACRALLDEHGKAPPHSALIEVSRLLAELEQTPTRASRTAETLLPAQADPIPPGWRPRTPSTEECVAFMLGTPAAGFLAGLPGAGKTFLVDEGEPTPEMLEARARVIAPMLRDFLARGIIGVPKTEALEEACRKAGMPFEVLVCESPPAEESPRPMRRGRRSSRKKAKPKSTPDTGCIEHSRFTWTGGKRYCVECGTECPDPCSSDEGSPGARRQS